MDAHCTEWQHGCRFRICTRDKDHEQTRKEDQAQIEYLRRWKEKKQKRKNLLEKLEKERHEMKYKVGDKVKVRSDLKTSVLYGSLYAVAEMIKKKIVTITYVYDGCYKVVEDDYAWTDEMLEGLAEDELTAEEAIILRGEMCEGRSCSRCKLSAYNNGTGITCNELAVKHPERYIEVLKQYKKDHEKKEIEVVKKTCCLVIDEKERLFTKRKLTIMILAKKC